MDYPNLSPVSISYDLGGLNISNESTITAGPVRFRHSLRLNNNILTLNYENLTSAEIALIRDHYNKSGGTHYYFSIPDSLVWGSSSGKIVSQSSLYRYNAIPEENQKGVYHDCTVELLILTANNLLYLLIGEDSRLGTGAGDPEESFSSFAFNGTAPFVLDGSSSSIELRLIGGGASL